ncbi:hypothetical protein S83_017867 [Arachis hypogaea]
MKQRTLLSTFNLTIVFSLLTRITVCSINPKFEACEPKTCGGTTNHQNVSFPFYIISKQNSYCGLPNFGLTCSHDGFPILNTSETLYTVQNIFYNNQSLRVSIPGLSPLGTKIHGMYFPTEKLQRPQQKVQCCFKAEASVAVLWLQEHARPQYWVFS